jgi:glucose-1-phosphate cytidylyltransferase
MTYGDGLANVNIDASIKQHEASGKIVTVTAVRPPGRFGAIEMDSDQAVTGFTEKPKGDSGWINGGFFVLNSKVFNYIDNDLNEPFETGPLAKIAEEGQLNAFLHEGFWQPCDTLRDLRALELQASSNSILPWHE